MRVNNKFNRLIVLLFLSFSDIIAIIAILVAIGIPLFFRRKDSVKERKKNFEIILSTRSQKMNGDVLDHLRLGRSLKSIQKIMSTYLKHTDEDFPIDFGDDTIKGIRRTNSYLYTYYNCDIKITSKDDKTIDSVTLIPFDKSFCLHEVAPLFDDDDNFVILDHIVTERFIEYIHSSEYYNYPRDCFFTLQTYIPNPYYKYYTFFGYSGHVTDSEKKEGLESFINGRIFGVCISGNSDDV